MRGGDQRPHRKETTCYAFSVLVEKRQRGREGKKGDKT